MFPTLEEHMESNEFLYERRFAIPQISDGIQGDVKIVPGCVNTNTNRSFPPLDHRNQIFQISEAAVSRHGHGFVALEVSSRPHVVIKDPEIVSHGNSMLQGGVQTVLDLQIFSFNFPRFFVGCRNFLWRHIQSVLTQSEVSYCCD